MGTYNRQGVVFERGEGAWLIDQNGERYLDFASGIAVNALGHNHPHLVAALQEQVGKLWHTSNLYRVAGQERLAERLCANTFADRVFFCNSGAEACEGVIKAARRYHYANGAGERTRIITFSGSFHGRTLATIAAAGNASYLEGFGEPASGFDHVPFGDHEALKAAITDETAAIMVEPVQGEGGIRVVPRQCLIGLRELCDEHGLLLIFDEVQSGMGRLGHLFAHQAAGIEPDLMAIAKGLGGGFPVGAFLASEAVGRAMVPGTHGSTFGGNMLAMACGNAVLDVMLADGFLEAVRDKALRLRQALAALHDEHGDAVEEIRGDGLLMGVKLKLPVGEVTKAASAQRLLLVGAGENVARIIPPLNATDEEIALGVRKLSDALASLKRAAS
ncbi:MAG: aspartate aminotransferase family protein [Pseudomonadota bacterium]